MTEGPYYSLRSAAIFLGISRYTLKKWLTREGLALPGVEQGSKVLISHADLERVVTRRTPRVDWRLLRGGAKQSRQSAA